MGRDFTMTIEAQPSIYQPKTRNLNIYYSMPVTGVNAQTGVLLLISGYGGNAASNVYQKMRHQFSDQYNFITVQCDYFGWEFMQSYKPSGIDLKRQIIVYNDVELPLSTTDDKNEFIVNVTMDETPSYFNDMGIMQALDNITAIKTVMHIFQSEHHRLNRNRIFTYGQSHGSYLAYFCNALMPHLFSGLIDNSSYLYPTYLTHSRISDFYFIFQKNTTYTCHLVHNYLAREYIIDNEIYDLNTLYSCIENQANIVCFHGMEDAMIPIGQKIDFMKLCKHANLETIDENRLGSIFQNTKHGLGADFLQLFHHVMKNYNLELPAGQLEECIIETEKCRYEITADGNMPWLYYYIK